MESCFNTPCPMVPQARPTLNLMILARGAVVPAALLLMATVAWDRCQIVTARVLRRFQKLSRAGTHMTAVNAAVCIGYASRSAVHRSSDAVCWYWEL